MDYRRGWSTCAFLFGAVFPFAVCHADIHRWDTGAVIAGTEGIEPGPAVQLSNRNLEFANLSDKNLANSKFDLSNLSSADFGYSNLYSATFISADLENANLTDAILWSARFTNANLTDANISNAKLGNATLTNTNMAGTVVTGTDFSATTSKGLTKEQLYATASYQAKNLQRIGLGHNQLAGWDFRGQDLTDASFVDSTLTNADLTGAIITGANFESVPASGLTKEQLYSTASYQAKNLKGIGLAANVLTGWDFTGQDISGADFGGTTWRGFTKEQLYSTASYQAKDLTGIGLAHNDLTGWDFTGQDISGADFSYTTWQGGYTKDQLYATASHQANDLKAVGLAGNDLSGWNFTGQNLQRADFTDSAMNGVNLAGADLRGAIYVTCTTYGCIDTWASALPTAIVANTILADGTVPGLVLAAGERMIIRDDDGGPNALPRHEYPDRLPSTWPPIKVTIKDHLAMADGSGLALLFDADPWDSLISFEPGIPLQLGGALELAFTDDVEVANQVGRTLRIFDWTGVSPIGQFVVRSPYLWDATNLYTTGEVRLVAVPEPSAVSIMQIGVLALVASGPILARKRLVDLER
jgi:uncharacterized protein YjbI with pentapeptide repeats